jgi:hypothetical protein
VSKIQFAPAKNIRDPDPFSPQHSHRRTNRRNRDEGEDNRSKNLNHPNLLRQSANRS